MSAASSSNGETVDSKSRNGWVVGSLLLCGVFFLVATFRYVHSERFFYFWDNFAYNRASLESLSALQASGISWLFHLRQSVQSGFSQLFTVPVAPLMWWLGDSRAVFIGSIVGCYLLPCAGICTLLVNRILPLRSWDWVLVFISCATLPVLWRASLSGYPDIGGLMIALVAILVVTGDQGYRRWTTAVWTGVLIALIFFFRRHLVYCIIPLVTAAACIAIIDALYLRNSNQARWQAAGGAMLRFGLTGVIAILLVWLIAPNYFGELVNTSYHDLYSPYQQPIADAWRQHRDYLGMLYWGLGLAGLGWGLLAAHGKKWICALLLGYAALSLGIWVFYLRYMSIQYNLHFAVVFATGTGLLTAFLARRFRRLVPAALLSGTLLALWADRLAFVSFVPAIGDRFLPSRFPPLRNPDYDEIRHLIDFLRRQVNPSSNNILVAASSQQINSDMLTVGEGSLYGRDRRTLLVMNGSHVDTVQPYSLRDMVAADWIIVAEPFQHHLRVEDQGVVKAVYDSMISPGPFASDFKKIEESFHLTNGVSLTLYKRVRPTAYLTQVATARMMFETVGTADAWNGPLMCGEAATGAEYYDARLVMPEGKNRYWLDLRQVRMSKDQASITVFVRVDQATAGHLVGELHGGAITIKAEFFPDRQLNDPSWSKEYPSADGARIDIPFPAAGPGIVALSLLPAKHPSAGEPLQLQFLHFAVQ